jgi:hypothetical protein
MMIAPSTIVGLGWSRKSLLIIQEVELVDGDRRWLSADFLEARLTLSRVEF